MICCHFFCSAVFSMPVCRKPIVGSADTMLSPSSSSTSLNTPCVLGCCGPMLTVIVSLRNSGMHSLPCSWRLRVPGGVLASQPHVPRKFFGRELQWRPRRRVLANLHRVVFAQRMPDPVVGHQDPPKIRMTVEADPDQVVN